MGVSVQHLQDTIGSGNWAIFPYELVSEVESFALEWKKIFDRIEKPWLCWCVDPDWCRVQQELVLACGWTPVVCVDSPTRKVKMCEEAIYVDFRSPLKFEGILRMHFCLEFVYSFCRAVGFLA